MGARRILSWSRRAALLALAALGSLSTEIACSSAEPASDGASAIVSGGLTNERPWEMTSEQGETVVPNVFYADDSQTEQIMPMAINGHVMIRRMIYPTLGNPKLYDKSSVSDSAMVGLRLEDALVAHLHPADAGTESGLVNVKLDSSPTDGVRVMLIARSARSRATESKQAVQPGNGIFALTPSRILKNVIDADMPEVLKKRSTYRFIFHKESLASVPAGLYDVRVEVLKGGSLVTLPGDREPAYEFQYNALRVFDQTPDEYPIVSVTDTQVSTGAAMHTSTETPFSEFVRFVNTTGMEELKRAPFIVFNGDLHQAGAYTGLSRAFVAPEYVNEMAFAIDQLKELPIPIHMIPGNHDGYASTGDTPKFLDDGDLLTFFNKSLKSVVASAGPGTWPDFDFDTYDRWRHDANSKGAFGGFPLDVYNGSFMRTPGKTFTEGWKEVPRAQRNYILYDGQYQWQRTIGPLHHSWKFGTSRFIGLNTFELRQHMRMAWGMYSTNYGGSMSPVQMEWLDRELARADADKSDVTLLTHHDPRGGTGHDDFGTYHGQEGFEKIHAALLGELSRYGGIFKATCEALTESDVEADRAEPEEDTRGCDEGKQIWHGADPKFDNGFASGPALAERISRNKNVRTLLYAHTHKNGLDMLQASDPLIPGKVVAGHELLVLELGSCASVTSATFDGAKVYGFQILDVSKKNDARGVSIPQINEVKYLKNVGGGRFNVIATASLQRTATMKRDNPQNPVNSVFK
jgi:hypothetical protein